jgi:xanthine/uracil permease
MTKSLFLVIMGVFSKFAAALVAIPSSVISGMTTFLFCSVAVSGIAIIARGVPFNRRNRFILTAGLALGYGATLVPNYFDNVFSYKGDNKALHGFLDAIVLIMETGMAVTAVVCIILNIVLEDEVEGDVYNPGPEINVGISEGSRHNLERKEDTSTGGTDEIQPASKEIPRFD